MSQVNSFLSTEITEIESLLTPLLSFLQERGKRLDDCGLASFSSLKARDHMISKHLSISLFFLTALTACGGSPNVTQTDVTSPKKEVVSPPRKSAEPFLRVSRFQKGPLPHYVTSKSPSQVIEALERGESFLLATSDDMCEASRWFWDDIGKYNGETKIYLISRQDETWPTFQPEPLHTILQWHSYLAVGYYLIKEGRLVDFSVTNANKLSARNLNSEDIDYNQLPRPGKNAEAQRKVAVIQSQLPYMSLQGVNLQGLKLRKKNYEGSDLRNADFKGAILEHINFSHANLQGASLSLAKSLDQIFWGRAVCPDGERAAPHPKGCQDHLTPSRVEGIKTDPAPSKSEYVVKQNELIDTLNTEF